MEYCVTMERTLRTAVWFEAPDDEAAEKKAAEINQATGLEAFEQGDVGHNYALCNAETHQVILDWD